MYNRTKHNQGFFICSPLTRHHYIEAMPTLQKCMSTTNEWLSKGKSNEWIKFRAKNFLFCNLFINEGECFIRVSKHEKTDESTGHLLINICSSTVFFWKLIFKHTCLDILTRVFGYLITRVWISNHACLDLFFTGYQGQMRPHNWLITWCIINEFEKYNYMHNEN